MIVSSVFTCCTLSTGYVGTLPTESDVPWATKYSPQTTHTYTVKISTYMVIEGDQCITNMVFAKVILNVSQEAREALV